MKKIFAVFIFILAFSCFSFAENWGALESKADDQLQYNNYKDAFLLYKKVILEHHATPTMYLNAVTSLKKAQMEKEFDSFFAAVLKKYANKTDMLVALAQSRMRVSVYGYIIAGKFERGYHRGGGQRVSSLERDRVEALKILLKISTKDYDKSFYNIFHYHPITSRM